MTRLDAEETRLLTELAEVRAAKATLRRVCGLADVPHGPTLAAEPTPPPTPPERPVKPTDRTPGKAEARPSSDGPGYDGHRRKMLALLAAGPLSRKAILDRCGIPKGSSAEVFGHPWFRKAGPEKTAPWELTPEGRAAAASAG